MNRQKLHVTFLIFSSALGLSVAFNNCSNTGFQTKSIDSNLLPSQSTSPTPSPSPTQSVATAVINKIDITVGGYGNEPYISVTICQPGTTNCVTIPNLLLDTGSTGLRIFSSALPANFLAAVPASNSGECYFYADNAVQWGSVQSLDVVLGQEKAPNVPMLIINNKFGDAGKSCYNNLVNAYIANKLLPTGTKCVSTNTQAQNPAGCPFFDSPGTNYNGIIGLNFLVNDCGAGCAASAQNLLYYLCNNGNCASSTMPVAQQVSNPIGYMSTDNNGLTLQLPAVPNNLGNNVTGVAYLGIGTQANNMPTGTTTLAADPNLADQCYTFFRTTFNNNTTCGFLDSGTNVLLFPSPGAAVLPVDVASGFYIPAAPKALTATNLGFNGTTSAVNFTIANVLNSLANFNVLSQIGAEDPNGPIAGYFDWGLPFFLGRTVYIGVEGKTSTIGSGFYWAY